MPLNTFPRKNDYAIPRGEVLLAEYDAENNIGPYESVGDCPSQDLTVETENYQHENYQNSLGQIDLDKPIRVTRTSNLTVDNVSLRNIARYLSAEVVQVTQASATVTAEAITGLRPEIIYQLGTTWNMAGSRNISSIVPTVTGAARANTTGYTKGQIYQPATPNNHLYACTVAGTSAASPPTFTTDGTTFADGTATFIDLGVINGLVSGTDFFGDGPNGLISIPAAGKLAALYKAAITAGLAATEFSINATVAYTQPLNVRTEVRAGTASSKKVRMLFKADNIEGTNKDVLIPLANLAPTGTLVFIGEAEASTMEFTLGIQLLDSSTPPVVVLGPSSAPA